MQEAQLEGFARSAGETLQAVIKQQVEDIVPQGGHGGADGSEYTGFPKIQAKDKGGQGSSYEQAYHFKGNGLADSVFCGSHSVGSNVGGSSRVLFPGRVGSSPELKKPGSFEPDFQNTGSKGRS